MSTPISDALQWGEEWQLRLLVLGSLVFQCFLLITAPFRKFPIRSYFKPFIWFAHLGCDALAIYALATLFNRHRKHDAAGHAHGNDILEVLWAPILLIHLGGQDGITAYNIEDNELWMRHLLTSLSQITIAIYVFCKSWPGDDKRLLQAAILLFVPGVLKCLEKPLALNSASINSLVSTAEHAKRTTKRQGKIDRLEDFVEMAKRCCGGNGGQGIPGFALEYNPFELFVDLASPSSGYRLENLLSFSALSQDEVYCLLQNNLSDTFNILYTKEKLFPTILNFPPTHQNDENTQPYTSLVNSVQKTVHRPMLSTFKVFCAAMLRVAVFLNFVAIGLFHHCHRKAYNDKDVKVTYTLLCCTAVLEFYNPSTKVYANSLRTDVLHRSSILTTLCSWIKPCMPNMNCISKTSERPTETYQYMDDKIFQYNLFKYFIRNRKHSKMMNIAGFLGCKDYLDQQWRMNSCSSSRRITYLVLGHVKLWWRDHITDVSAYRKFNDIRGQWTLQFEGCFQQLGWSLEGAFDESVLLWHIATNFCYHHIRGSYDSEHAAIRGSYDCEHAAMMCIHGSSYLNNRFPTWCGKCLHHKNAVQCQEMSNYMMYLLFVNPVMLMAGTRRNLFKDAYNQLKSIMKDSNTPLNENDLMQTIIAKMKQPLETSNERGFIDDAWSIAEELIKLEDTEKMWRVIEGVWVEMLCFSAARCRGYLHAKGLGTGVEFLTYVWLLLHYMGMETLAEKLARAELPNGARSSDSSTTHVGASSSKEQVAGASTSYAS
uniref:DUF4220 domain-containing protein n=1 Tax=Oryza rufipogon TaxID=4529 RepID=A0A0E0N2Z2_ORYRU